MRKNTPVEVHIALNVLADLEIDAPLLAHSLRRLLPALARDFASAGKPVSEAGLHRVIRASLLTRTPLHHYFNKRPANFQESLSYADLGRQFNTRMNHKSSLKVDDYARFGLTQMVKNHYQHNELTQIDINRKVWQVAANGHYELTRFFIDQTNEKDRGQTIDRAIQAAIQYQPYQFHILYNIIKDYGPAYAQKINSSGNIYMKSDTQALYNAYLTLIKNFEASKQYSPACFSGLEAWQHVSVRMADYMRIHEMLAYEEPNMVKRNRTAFKAAMVFQSSERVLRFMKQWAKEGTEPLKSLIDQIDAPIAQAAIDWKGWGDALLKFGPDIGTLVKFAHQVTSPVRNYRGEISLRGTRNYIWKHCFPEKHRNIPLAEMCFLFDRSNEIFEKALTMLDTRRTQPVAVHKTIPDITIDGKHFDLPDYTLRRLPYDDIRMMFLGDFTGCCERIDDHFEHSIAHALKSGESAFYVLMKDDEIRLHTWVWRGEGGQMVIDGYESRDPAITTKHLVNMTYVIGRTLDTDAYKAFRLTDIILGRSGKNFFPEENFNASIEKATRFICENYYNDERPDQWLVRRITMPTAHKPFIEPSHDPKYQPR